jgi:hypothetical protein
MNRFSLQFLTDKSINHLYTKNMSNYFNKNMNYYICSSGGCGSTVIYNYLSNFGNVYHIHDRFPPNNLTYIGNENTNEEVYSEWFNNIEIPKEKLNNYKVIFIYRHPIEVIFSRFAQAKGPNINHLKHIKCDNGGNINIFDVIRHRKDLYKMEEFFNNYTIPSRRNYEIYAIKYELFWNNISLFNNVLKIPDIVNLYPVKQERLKKYEFVKELNYIYKSLISKMNNMRFLEIIKPIQMEVNEKVNNEVNNEIDILKL